METVCPKCAGFILTEEQLNAYSDVVAEIIRDRPCECPILTEPYLFREENEQHS